MNITMKNISVLHQRPCNVDMLGFTVFFHASLKHLNTTVTTVWHQSKICCYTDLFLF